MYRKEQPSTNTALEAMANTDRLNTVMKRLNALVKGVKPRQVGRIRVPHAVDSRDAAGGDLYQLYHQKGRSALTESDFAPSSIGLSVFRWCEKQGYHCFLEQELIQGEHVYSLDIESK